MIGSFTFVKVLPFLAVLILEIVSRQTTDKFIYIYNHYFDSEEYDLVKEEPVWEDILRNELGNINQITDSDIKQIAEALDEGANIDNEKLRDYISDYVWYSDDWIRTKVSIFVTFLSALVIFYDKAINNVESLGWILLLSAIILIGLFIFSSWTDYYFENMSPHRYSSGEDKKRYSRVSILLLAINTLIVVIIIIIDLVLN